jgi:hypothetical protein
MTHFVLTVLDTIGIQDYIFRSNRLCEHVTASHLVELATGEWLYDALQQTVGPINVQVVAVHTITTSRKTTVTVNEYAVTDDGPLDQRADRHAEVVYRGGGNVVLLFRGETAAQAMKTACTIIEQYSRRLLVDAPDLQIAVAHQPFVWSDAIGGTNGVYEQAMRLLDRNKSRRRAPSLMPGMSVTLTCRSTGLPATDFDREDATRPVSAQVAAKIDHDMRDAADLRLRQLLQDQGIPKSELNKFTFSRDLDDLGRARGEMSYVAVMHADGNGMGLRLQNFVRSFDSAAKNRECLNKLRSFSQALETAGGTALQVVLQQLLQAMKLPHMRSFVEILPLLKDNGEPKPVFPVRPLVFGGDDVTLVCDGRIGLTLAAAYLDEFERQAAKLPDGKPGFSCAGVAIVKTHYPFARAYHLSEELCRSAKKMVQEHHIEDASALDWYFAGAGIADELEMLRKRFYRVEEGDLTIRPVLLRPGLTWHTWSGFRAAVNTLNNDEQWIGRRNKVIALREALRGGPAMVRQFRSQYGLEKLALPPFETADKDYLESGWIGDRCVYFDAIEAMDFYLPLEAPEAKVQTEVTP